MAKDAWKAKTTRNYIYQTIDFKAAIVLDATPTIHAEPLSVDVTTQALQDSENAVKHELQRMKWDRIRRRVFRMGAVCGKGIAHLYHEVDALSGESKLRLEIIDPSRFYPDPSALSIDEAEYVCYTPKWDLARIRNAFPDKGPLVKPTSTEKIGDTNLKQDERHRTDEELIYGPNRELGLDKDGKIKERSADVCLVWIKDPEVVWNVISDEDGELKQQGKKKYPYGRLIAYSGTVLLYDGPSPYELEEVFPFYEYVHYDDPERFWGYGDVALLKSIQMVADKNAAMILDAQRLTSMGSFEYPIGADGYEAGGTQPGQRVPVPPELIGMARWVVPQGYNAQLHQVLDEMVLRDFQRVSGISDVSAGLAPSAPTSGVEVQARQRAAATRIGSHLKNMNEFSSSLAQGVFQMLRQLSPGPMSIMSPGPAGEMIPTIVDMGAIPGEVNIKVDADPDEIEKNRLTGQVIAGFATSILTNPMATQMLAPYLDILLPKMGLRPQEANELQKRIYQVMASQPPPVMPPGPGAPTPDAAGPPMEEPQMAETGGEIQ